MTLPIELSKTLSFAAIICFSTALNAHGQVALPRLSFSPAEPIADQPIAVTLFTPNGCSPEGSIHSVRNGMTVTISHVFTKAPAAVAAACEEATVIGPLAVGHYRVEWVHDYRFQGQMTLVATATLTVKARPS